MSTREDALLAAATGAAILAFGFGWGFGRQAGIDSKRASAPAPAPFHLACPACPACPAPTIRLPPAQVVVTACDPLENLRVAPVVRHQATPKRVPAVAESGASRAEP